MIQTITKHVLDILQGDARLYQPGLVFTAGWPGVKRQKTGDTPTAGYVNIFDRTYEPSGVDHRPGIYVGTKARQAVDTLHTITASGATGTRQQLRQLTLPLVLVVSAQGQGATALYAADDQRGQLLANVRQILFGHLVESTYWWQMEFPGAAGGPLAQIQTWESVEGQGAQSIASAFATFPLVINYTYNGGSQP